MILTDRLEKAIRVSAMAHRNQKRKGNDLPYIVHPFSVMLLASEATADEDVLIACLFHDIIEDVPSEYPESKMTDEFGERVVEIVKGVTKNSDLKDWKERSDAYLDHLRNKASDESVLVSSADKIHNLMSILEDYETIGDEVWSKFNSGKEDQLWWYRSVLEVVSTRLPHNPLNSKLDSLVKKMAIIIE